MAELSPLCKITFYKKDIELEDALFSQSFVGDGFKGKLEVLRGVHTRSINVVVNFWKVTKTIEGIVRFRIGDKFYSPVINIDYDVPTKSDDIPLITIEAINQLFLVNDEVTFFLDGKLKSHTISTIYNQRKPSRFTPYSRDSISFPISEDFFNFETVADKVVITMSREVMLDRNFGMRWQIGVNARAGLSREDVRFKFYLHKTIKTPIKASFTFRIAQVGGGNTDWVTKSFTFGDTSESDSFFIISRKDFIFKFYRYINHARFQEPELIVKDATFSFV